MAVKGTREKNSSGMFMGLILFAIIIIIYMVMSGTMNPMAAIRSLFNTALSYLPAEIERLVRDIIQLVVDILRRILRELMRFFERLL